MSIDIGGYRHNYEGLYKNFTYLMFINKKTTTTHDVHVSVMRILSFILFIS